MRDGEEVILTPTLSPAFFVWEPGWGSAASEINDYFSENVVIVMVWLCNSHFAPGVNGEISPYE